MNQALAMDEGSLTVRDINDVTDDIAAVDERILRAFAWPGRIRKSAECGWHSTVSRQLNAIETLPDNWDSSESVAPKPRTIMAARSLLELIVGNASEVAKPHVCPTPAGGVQIDWQSGSRYFEIEVTDANSARYYFEDRDASDETESTILLGEPINPIVFLLRRVEMNQ